MRCCTTSLAGVQDCRSRRTHRMTLQQLQTRRSARYVQQLPLQTNTAHLLHCELAPYTQYKWYNIHNIYALFSNLHILPRPLSPISIHRFVHKQDCANSTFLSASLYVSKRGAYWYRLCRDVVGRRWLVGRWLSRACTVAKRCILGL